MEIADYSRIISKHIQTNYPGNYPTSEQSMASLARACAGRQVPKGVLIGALRKSREFVPPGSLHPFISMLAGDTNLVHVLEKAPAEALPKSFSKFKDPDERAKFVARTVLDQVGIKGEEAGQIDNHAPWLRASRELGRLAASGKYLENDLVKRLLSDSYRENHYQTYDEFEPNEKTKSELKRLGVRSSVWLQSPFVKTYDVDYRRVNEFKGEANAQATSEFNRLLVQGYSKGRTNGMTARKIAAMLKRSGLETDRYEVRAALDPQVAKLSSQGGPDAPYKLEQQQMNRVLLETIDFIQGKIERSRTSRNESRFVRADTLQDYVDDLVALQRVLSPHDPTVSLSEPSGPAAGEPRYMIRKENKNPVTFLTGGNDSGVCDSTMDKERFRRAFLAMNYGYQEGSFFKLGPKGQERRFGQVRMYAATSKSGSETVPTLIINSIDLEAEERNNLFLYRTGIDYAKDFARACGYKRVLLGRHADMAVVPFDSHPLFSDLVPKDVEVKLAGNFPPDMVFSDIFGGGDHMRVSQGTSSFYEVPMGA